MGDKSPVGKFTRASPKGKITGILPKGNLQAFPPKGSCRGFLEEMEGKKSPRVTINHKRKKASVSGILVTSILRELVRSS